MQLCSKCSTSFVDFSSLRPYNLDPNTSFSYLIIAYYAQFSSNLDLQKQQKYQISTIFDISWRKGQRGGPLTLSRCMFPMLLWFYDKINVSKCNFEANIRRALLIFQAFRMMLTLYDTLYEPHPKNCALFNFSTSFTEFHNFSDGFDPISYTTWPRPQKLRSFQFFN